MKTTILSITLVLTFMSLTTSCKKGENDPFLSLKTRDSRITGTWELTKLEYSSTSVYTFDGTSTTSFSTRNFDGTLLTTISSGDTYSYSYSHEMTIEKDGSYIVKTILDGALSETSGSWWWLDDKKRKTRLALDDDLDSYEIDRLTNKELVLKVDYSSRHDSDGEVETKTISETLTFNKNK